MIRRRPAICAPHSLRAPRAGLTILEVILSVGLFLAAMTVIGQMITTGTRAQIQTDLETDAMLRAQAKMGEVLSGVEDMASGQGVFDDDGWAWDLNVLQTGDSDLLTLELTVSHTLSTGDVNASFTMTRLARDLETLSNATASDSSAGTL